MRIRFAISLILVAVVSILAVVGFAQFSTAREINTYMFRGGMAGLNVLVNNLEQFHQLNNSWEGVAPLFDERPSANNHMPGMMGQAGPGGARDLTQQHLIYGTGIRSYSVRYR